MIAEQAGKLVAGFIDRRWPEDSEDIFQIIKLGVNKAWQEGKWTGMTAEFFVRVQRDEQGHPCIIAPPSHPILLASNYNGEPATIRDKYFMFHKNGRGDIRNSSGCSWNTSDVYDMGYIPILPINNIILKKGFRVGVRAIGDPGRNEKVWINGAYADGNKIYSYKLSSLGDPCGCKFDKNKVDTINGIQLDITNKFNYISNVTFDSILSISKTVTRTPIEVIAIDEMGNGHVLARLDPNQKKSKYRKYLVPEAICHFNTIHGLFKIAQQEDITSPTDNINVDNDEALICFAMGIHCMYWKKQQQEGASYIIQGIGILEKEKREEDSPNEFPIQVAGIIYEDLPNALRYNH